MRSISATNHGKREEGFTIIEMTIVIVIIGILAAISLPIIQGVQRSTIEATVKSDVRASAANILKSQYELNQSLQLSLNSTIQSLFGPKIQNGGDDLTISSFVTPEQFAEVAQVSDNNSLVLSIATDPGTLKQYACLWGSHVFADEDIISYYYDSRTGRITQESCLGENFGDTEVIAGVSDTPVVEEPTTEPEPAPAPTQTTPAAPNVPGAQGDNKNVKYPVCHASANGKWNLLMLPLSAFNGNGHDGHSTDVIPPVTGEYSGKNWDEAGWVIWQKWCG